MNLEHFSENRYSEKILSPEGPSTLKTSFFQHVSKYREAFRMNLVNFLENRYSEKF